LKRDLNVPCDTFCKALRERDGRMSIGWGKGEALGANFSSDL